jgi:hypothetical protein
MPKPTIKRSSRAIPTKPTVYGDPSPLYPSPPPSPKHPVVDLTALPENPELAIAMRLAETAAERSTARSQIGLLGHQLDGGIGDGICCGEQHGICGMDTC